MNSRLNLSLVSPEKIIFEGEVSSITLPGVVGSFTILPRHVPIVSSLKEGKLIYVNKEGEQIIEICNGFVEMSGEEISVCITLKKNENDGNK
ncbi:F0F1 ATP synthase subunit epsilon [Bacteroides sp. 519]|uniref:F0F1 ATP synthase subunit epsilon n=1 Tax=Bacteroides sp. 519 TaxID=2302937 RepID=UPI0013D0BA22|nr:F0F1 ATP synthase subunit epsilon [Bacteroides sp. 519]NDV58545.1 F0F1 ATP synthase subunit epsilon [Bacteroides sp. 519]